MKWLREKPRVRLGEGSFMEERRFSKPLPYQGLAPKSVRKSGSPRLVTRYPSAERAPPSMLSSPVHFRRHPHEPAASGNQH